ncbi:MAG: TatD family hydrolase [Leptospiraceae bacterium]|nr:TatD family hydrolase [Leptospiraceae bacterium]MCP5493519.1 TatD family hydrolase [Leptospiraceae bacterium]
MKNYKLIDTHCHLDIIEEQGLSIPESIQKAKEAGLEKMVQIGINYETSVLAKDLSHQYAKEDVYYTIGCHPVYDIQEDESNKILGMIEKNVDDPRLVGVGEIGLDYYHKKSSPKSQMETFHKFLDISVTHKLPVIIHSRDAEEDTFQALSEYKGKAFGVIHCFTYNQEYAHKFMELGYYISFSGIVSFKNATDIHKAASSLPLESVLIETDSPFLTPPPFRGKRNDPSNLKYILERMFSLRDETNIEVENKIFENSIKFIQRKAYYTC